MNLNIRDADETEIGDIVQLSIAGAVVNSRYPSYDPTDPAYLAAFRAIAADPNHRLIVAEDAGTIVGCMQISFIPGLPGGGAWRGQLENVHVRADYRGKGVGSMLTEWAIERCSEKGCKLVQLTSNAKRHDAHRFYERHGFVKSHAGFKLEL